MANDAYVKGIYLADVSSKSAQYCASGMSGGTGLLLLVEAELGKPMYEIPTGSSGAGEEAKKRGCYTTLGVGRTAPQGWTDGEFIHGDLKGVQVVSDIPFHDFPLFIPRHCLKRVEYRANTCRWDDSRTSTKAGEITKLQTRTATSSSTSISHTRLTSSA